LKTVRIGSRESKLAVIQSNTVVDYLRSRGIPAELVTMKTTGDKILNKTLDKIGGKGLFVKELDQALMDGRSDLSVHSLKDMPMEVPESLPIVGFSRREDPRDVLVLPPGVTEIDFSKPIGSSSFRRRIQIEKLFPEARVESVRGNVQTRLRKLDEGQYGAIVLAAAVVLIAGLVLIFGGDGSAPTASTNAPSNDARVAFLESFGWDVTTSPVESDQVKIPKESSEVFDRYNSLQKSQGYDLSAYAGKTVMRYVYRINNYPGATEPVYATVLVFKNQIIGGDVTDTSAKGVVRGFKKPAEVPNTQPPTVTTEPTEGSAPATPSK
jgi:hypothetical protein